jgi:hypothetical protein
MVKDIIDAASVLVKSGRKLGSFESPEKLAKDRLLRQFVDANPGIFEGHVKRNKLLQKKSNSVSKNFVHASNKKPEQILLDVENISSDKWILNPIDLQKFLSSGMMEFKTQSLMHMIKQRYQKRVSNLDQSDFFEDEFIVQVDQDEEALRKPSNNGSVPKNGGSVTGFMNFQASSDPEYNRN